MDEGCPRGLREKSATPRVKNRCIPVVMQRSLWDRNKDKTSPQGRGFNVIQLDPTKVMGQWAVGVYAQRNEWNISACTSRLD